jgi:hypothetical protein
VSGLFDECAAVIAAIEQFLADTARPPAGRLASELRWLETARLEGIEQGPSREPWLR